MARPSAARIGLRALLESNPRIIVVGEAAHLAGLNETRWQGAHVVVLDGESAEISDTPRAPGDSLPGIVLLGGSPALQRTISASGGPVGLLSADASAEQIRVCIAAVAAGLFVLEPGPDGELPAPLTSDAYEAVSPGLTPREHEVIELVASGFTNKGIALRLGISEHTVKFHLASVLSKLGAGSRAEAVAQAVRLGIIAL